jgi:hypothetical protein
MELRKGERETGSHHHRRQDQHDRKISQRSAERLFEHRFPPLDPLIEAAIIPAAAIPAEVKC